MSNQIAGKLHIKYATTTVSDKFTKRDFVLVTPEQYPQYISFQLTQDKVTLIDQVNAGDEIMVNFNLRGREWKAPDGTVKYFNTLECWSLSVTGKAQPAAVAEHTPDKFDNEVPF